MRWALLVQMRMLRLSVSTSMLLSKSDTTRINSEFKGKLEITLGSTGPIACEKQKKPQQDSYNSGKIRAWEQDLDPLVSTGPAMLDHGLHSVEKTKL